MTFQAFFQHKKLKPALGGVLVAVLGWQLCPFQLGAWLAELSYDLPFLFTVPSAPSNVVLVEMDEVSHGDLKQTYGEDWDRRLHAHLLDHLRTDGADLVVFDVVFTDLDRNAGADAELAAAIRGHGRVVLAADVDDTRRNGIVGASVLPPNDILRDATIHWGPTQAERGSDGVIRKIYPGTESKPSMAWVAAGIAKLNVNLKFIPDVDGKPKIVQLVGYHLSDITLKGAWAGPARLHLVPHVNCRVADLPVRKILFGRHIIADLTLPYGEVLHDYLA